jgi:molybdopterin converting factor small subunit
MSIKINILPYLQYHTGGKTVVEVEGSTVAECLDDLIGNFAGLRTVLFDSNGKLLDYVDIYVNGESSYYEGLARSVQDGDELHVILIISGG